MINQLRRRVLHSQDHALNVKPVAREDALLEVTNVTIAVGHSQARREILRDVSLQVNAGEIVGLIGPNGVGKSTLLAACSGDLAVERGEVRLAGYDYRNLNDKQAAQLRAVMLQDTRVAFSYTVDDVVRMGRSPWPRDPEADEAMVIAALKQVDLLHYRDRNVANLSGGERARCALARVIVQQSQLLLLDEPSSAMDIAHSEKTMGILRKLADKGVGVMLVLHDLATAAAHCDRLVLLAEGGVIATGTPQEVCTDEHLSAAYQWPVRCSYPDGEVFIRPQRIGALKGECSC